MDGLEFSEVQYSKIEKENRYDSEYFQKVFFENEDLIYKHPHFRVGDYFKVTDGEHGSVQYMDQGVKYLTAENIKHGYVDVSNVRYVSQSVNIKNARASVEAEDILISIKGTLGSIAIAEGSIVPCNMNRDVAILKPLDKNTLLNSYVAYFMMSKYGLLQSSRGGSGGVQQMITLERLRQFIVPEFDSDFYRAMSKITQEFNLLRERSEAFYNEAEKCLQKHLPINSTNNQMISIKYLSASFGESGRLDAEYYQPKYEQIESTIRNKNYTTLDILCDVESGEFISETLYGEKGVSYIRGADITSHCVDIEHATKVDVSIDGLNLIETGDLAFAMIGSVGNVSINRGATAVVSNNLGTIKPHNKQISNYLLVYLLSNIGQALFEKYQTRTAQPKIKKEDVEKFIVPILPDEDVRFISCKVEEAFELKEKAQALLNAAIKTIEIAIESDEESALLWLESQK